LIDDEKHITTQWFKDEGDAIILIGMESARPRAAAERDEGVAAPSLGGSRYLKVCYGLKIGPPPYVDLAHEIKVQNTVRDLIRRGLVKSAHDCSEGGLAVALAESCFNPEKLFGMEINVKAGDTPAATVLFNESQSRIVISVAPENLDNIVLVLRERDVLFQQLGKVCEDELRIQVNNERFTWSIADLYDDWWNSIRRLVESDASAERIPSL
jgi:phosphoribosylformylglycinamidine synthase